MSFDYVGDVDGGFTKNLEKIVLGNSKTIAVGELIRTYNNAGAADNGAAAVPNLGVVMSIARGNAGNLPEVKAEATAGAQNTSDTQSVTTAADNVTTEKYVAFVNTSKKALYSAQVAGTLGTTVDSDFRGVRINVDSANTNYDRLLETTATRTVATTANFYSRGVDPEDATRLIVSLASSEQDSDANTEA